MEARRAELLILSMMWSAAQNHVRLQAFAVAAPGVYMPFSGKIAKPITHQAAREFLLHFLPEAAVVNVWVHSSNRYARVQLDSISSKALAIRCNTTVMDRNGHYMRVHEFSESAQEDAECGNWY